MTPCQQTMIEVVLFGWNEGLKSQKRNGIAELIQQQEQRQKQLLLLNHNQFGVIYMNPRYSCRFILWEKTQKCEMVSHSLSCGKMIACRVSSLYATNFKWVFVGCARIRKRPFYLQKVRIRFAYALSSSDPTLWERTEYGVVVSFARIDAHWFLGSSSMPKHSNFMLAV